VVPQLQRGTMKKSPFPLPQIAVRLLAFIFPESAHEPFHRYLDTTSHVQPASQAGMHLFLCKFHALLSSSPLSWEFFFRCRLPVSSAASCLTSALLWRAESPTPPPVVVSFFFSLAVPHAPRASEFSLKIAALHRPRPLQFKSFFF